MAEPKHHLVEVTEKSTLSEIKKAYSKGEDEEESHMAGKEYDVLVKLQGNKTSKANNQFSNPHSYFHKHTPISKVEKITHFFNESIFKITFGNRVSTEDQLACIFNGIQNKFGFNDKQTLNESKEILGKRGKHIATVTYHGTSLRKVDTIINHPVKRTELDKKPKKKIAKRKVKASPPSTRTPKTSPRRNSR